MKANTIESDMSVFIDGMEELDTSTFSRCSTMSAFPLFG